MEKGGSWPGLWRQSMSYDMRYDMICTKLDWWIGVCCAVQYWGFLLLWLADWFMFGV